MAAMEEPSALTGIEPCRSLTEFDLNDMKNTARKSTAKQAPAVLTDKSVNSPGSLTNGDVDSHVSNGNGIPCKRLVESEEVGNPAKAARLQIEEMEKAQEEMTRKLSRSETTSQNGDGAESINSQDSKHSINSKTSLLLTAEVRNNFKGILDVAMNKIGSQRRSSNDSSHSLPDLTDRPSSEESKEPKSCLDMVPEMCQENPEKTHQGNSNTTENGQTSQTDEQHKLLKTPEDDINIAEKDGITTLESCDAANQNCDEKTDSICESAPVEQNTSESVSENVHSNGVTLTEDVLLGADHDVEGDVDDAVLLSDDDDDVVVKDANVDASEKVLEEKDKEIDACSDNSSDHIENRDDSINETLTVTVLSEESNSAIGTEESKEIETPMETEQAVESQEKTQNDNPQDFPTSHVNSINLVSPPRDSSESVADCEETAKDTENSNKTKVAAVNVKGVDIPVDSIINLDDDDDDNSQGPDNPIEIEDDVDIDNESDVSEASRKRNATSPIPSEASSTTKKTRLDKVIDQLGNDRHAKADESASKTNEVKPLSEAGDDLNKTETTDLKTEVKQDVKPKSATNKENIITAAASEINGLLVTRMNAYFNRTRDSEIMQYKRQIGELQAAVESWRTQAKRLAKQLDEQRLSQSRNPRKRRKNNSDESPKNTQSQAANLQQNSGGPGGKILVRPGPRTVVRTPGPVSGPAQGINNMVPGQQMRPMMGSQTAAQAKTVRDLLDKQRGVEPGKKVLIQGNRIITQNPQMGPRGVGPAIRPGPAGGKSVIDLTDDDDRRAGPPSTTRVVQISTPTTGIVRVPTPTSAAVRPGPVLVQQMATTVGPVIMQQARPPPGTAYVYTTRPATSPGTTSIRGTAPPMLRPASQTVTVNRGPTSSSLTRPPPPLRSAPTNNQAKHPAPLPAQPEKQTIQAKVPPPKPGLKISRVQSGIVLSWNMTVSDNAATISSYQLFAYQETSAAPATSLWKKVGDVKALPLPMACTLTQFQEGNKYHFAVRAVDVHSRVGPFSEPSSIALTVINVS